MCRPIPQYSNSIWRSLSPSMGTPRSSTKPRPSNRSSSIDTSNGPVVGRGKLSRVISKKSSPATSAAPSAPSNSCRWVSSSSRIHSSLRW